MAADITDNEAKDQLLLSYEIVPEWYQKKCRTQGKGDNETFRDHAYNLINLFERWIKGQDAHENIDRLKEIVLLE